MVHLRVDKIVGGYSRGQVRAQRPDKQGGLFRPWKGGVGIVVKDRLWSHIAGVQILALPPSSHVTVDKFLKLSEFQLHALKTPTRLPRRLRIRPPMQGT